MQQKAFRRPVPLEPTARIMQAGIEREKHPRETEMRTLTYSLLGAAAIAAGVLLVRQQKQVEEERPKQVPAGETVPAVISLEKLRELGI